MTILKRINRDFNKMLLKATSLVVIGAFLFNTVSIDLALGQNKGKPILAGVRVGVNPLSPSQSLYSLRAKAFDERALLPPQANAGTVLTSIPFEEIAVIGTNYMEISSGGVSLYSIIEYRTSEVIRIKRYFIDLTAGEPKITMEAWQKERSGGTPVLAARFTGLDVYSADPLLFLEITDAMLAEKEDFHKLAEMSNGAALNLRRAAGFMEKMNAEGSARMPELADQWAMIDGKGNEEANKHKNYLVSAARKSNSGKELAIAFVPERASLSSIVAGKVIIWDIAERKHLLELTDFSPLRNFTFHDIRFSPDDKIIISLHSGFAANNKYETFITLWSVESGKKLGEFPASIPWKGDPKRRANLAVSPDGKFVAVVVNQEGYYPCGMQIVYISGRFSSRIIPLLDDTVFNKPRVEFSPDGTAIAIFETGSEHLYLFDSGTSRRICKIGQTYEYPQLNYKIADAFFLRHSGDLLVWLNSPGMGLSEIALFDAKTKLEKYTPLTLGPEKDKAITCVAVSPDGRTLAEGKLNGDILVRDTETGNPLYTIKEDAIEEERQYGLRQSISFSDDGLFFASASGNSVKTWDAASGREVNSVEVKGLVAISVVSLNNRVLMIKGSDIDDENPVLLLWPVSLNLVSEFSGPLDHIAPLTLDAAKTQTLQEYAYESEVMRNLAENLSQIVSENSVRACSVRTADLIKNLGHKFEQCSRIWPDSSPRNAPIQATLLRSLINDISITLANMAMLAKILPKEGGYVPGVDGYPQEEWLPPQDGEPNEGIYEFPEEKDDEEEILPLPEGWFADLEDQIRTDVLVPLEKIMRTWGKTNDFKHIYDLFINFALAELGRTVPSYFISGEFSPSSYPVNFPYQGHIEIIIDEMRQDLAYRASSYSDDPDGIKFIKGKWMLINRWINDINKILESANLPSITADAKNFLLPDNGPLKSALRHLKYILETGRSVIHERAAEEQARLSSI